MIWNREENYKNCKSLHNFDPSLNDRLVHSYFPANELENERKTQAIFTPTPGMLP